MKTIHIIDFSFHFKIHLEIAEIVTRILAKTFGPVSTVVTLRVHTYLRKTEGNEFF